MNVVISKVDWLSLIEKVLVLYLDRSLVRGWKKDEVTTGTCGSYILTKIIDLEIHVRQNVRRI